MSEPNTQNIVNASMAGMQAVITITRKETGKQEEYILTVLPKDLTNSTPEKGNE